MLVTLQSKTFCLFVVCLEMFIISPMVLYGCETWSLTLREDVSGEDAEENAWTEEK
jgi:hypothetical protein